jgi:hypothetical protein
LRGAWRARGWGDPTGPADPVNVDADKAQLLLQLDGLRRTLERLTARINQLEVSGQESAAPPAAEAKE